MLRKAKSARMLNVLKPPLPTPPPSHRGTGEGSAGGLVFAGSGRYASIYANSESPCSHTPLALFAQWFLLFRTLREKCM